jgi:hypothetical protein
MKHNLWTALGEPHYPSDVTPVTPRSGECALHPVGQVDDALQLVKGR